MRRRDPIPTECPTPVPAASTGLFLREARTNCGLKQRELAKLAESSQSYISRIESGLASPTVKELNRLFEAMGERLILSAEHN